MPIIQTHSPYSFSSSTLTPSSTFFIGKNPTLKLNFAPFIRTKPQRLVLKAAGTDYYKTLNLDRNANLKDIKTSYRKLARQYHPDMNKGSGAEDKFKEISAAYEVLSDEEKRATYDRFGEAGLQGEYGSSNMGSAGVDPFDVFDAFFGGRGGSGGMNFNVNINTPNTGNQSLDIWYELHLSFEESIFGGQREFELSCIETCDTCSGTGAKSDDCIKSCTACGGRGGVTKTQRTPFGMISMVSTCSKCDGQGTIITDSCKKCIGKGQVKSKRAMVVTIPAGVSDGDTMKVQGEGNVDKRRGVVGDVYIMLRINEKAGIRRDGLNLYSTINIDYTEAILGTVIKVETVEGMKELKIPSGIQPGETVKLSRMGVPNMRKPSVRGDHHFVVNVLIPKRISGTERTLVEELASLKTSKKGHSGASKGIGTQDGNSDMHSSRNHETSTLSQGKRRVSSLWNSIKGVLGGRQSHDRFASVSVDRPALLRGSSQPYSFYMASIFGVIVVTCICTFIGKTKSITLSQHKDKHRTNNNVDRNT
ncbi:PREDICTED: dnaJ homolog subfamily A member 3, mitochondrial isoform X1 [Fragaria vesca subsp. vesca]|uniref:dnaJ homolog subfamily A member 3, mitochondrial isoform X1 n=2 Tax=Fragaria vesca subsp. vesca TaxID=101020 RepID=UPI0002C3728C|nr:PREDICTED: dnaJ homolog subfamily A member 3, mitochondrial isoform X1 [Fragaria vesca subsp. vesca]